MKYFYFILYSKTKRIKFRLSLISLILLIFLFGVSFVFSVFFLFQRVKLKEQKEMYSNLYADEKIKLQSLEEQITETSEFYEDYYDNLTNYSIKYFKELDEKNKGQISNDLKPIFQNMGIIDDSKVFEWAQNAYSIKSFLNKLKGFKEVKEKFLALIPNGWPIEKKIGYITSVYGPRVSPFDNKVRMHEGIDISAPTGTAIKSMADGVILFSGVKKGYGNVIMVRHEYGYSSLYAHCDKLLKRVNQKVKKGDAIATVGNTGRSTAPHLHLEIRLGNKIINPWIYLSSDN